MSKVKDIEQKTNEQKDYIKKLIAERDHWRNEAIEAKAQLGEIRMILGKKTKNGGSKC